MTAGKLQTVLEVDPTGAPIVPITAADLALLGKDATLTSLQADVQALHADLAALRGDVQAARLPSTKAIQVTVDLSGAHADLALGLGTITEVHSVTIRDLTSGTMTIKLGATTEPALAVVKGEVRDGLKVPGVWVSNPAGGGTANIEIHGR